MKDKREERQFDPKNYPALREFCPAYLHQDFEDEYGSAAEALKGFLADASRDEILQVKEEWTALRKALRGRPLQEIRRALGRLRSSWVPENDTELQELDEILGRT
jgi:hypothetical protein